MITSSRPNRLRKLGLGGKSKGWLLSQIFGGCSLWVASFGSSRCCLARKEVSPMVVHPCLNRMENMGWNHYLRPADVGKDWTLLSLPVQYKYCTGNCQSVQSFAYIGWWLAKVPSKESQIALAISESAGEPQTLLRDSGISDGRIIFSLFVPQAAPQGCYGYLPAAPCCLGKIFRCKGKKPLPGGLGIHCQQAEIFLMIGIMSVFLAVVNEAFRLPCASRLPF